MANSAFRTIEDELRAQTVKFLDRKAEKEADDEYQF